MQDRALTPKSFLMLTVTVFLLPTVAMTQGSNEDRGAQLLAPFKMQLKQALVSGMQQGPTVAIDVCKGQAPAIVKMLAVDGVEMGRSSHRLRNPENAPRNWVKLAIEDYLLEDADLTPKLVQLSKDRRGYVEPIETQALCLTCHGESLASEVGVQLRQAYPEDQATGFKVGDLRGVFWVEYPSAAAED